MHVTKGKAGHPGVTRLSLEDDVSVIEIHLRTLDLKTINTNYIVAKYLEEFYGVKFMVDGHIRGAGWISLNLPNFETIRRTYADMRNVKDHKREQQYKEVFTKKN